MRNLAVVLVAVVAVAVVAVARSARAADFFVETVSAADGGSSPASTSASNPKFQGNEVAIRCDYDAYLKVCDSRATTCVAVAHGQLLLSGKDFPVCFPTGYGQAAVFPTDGGTRSCDFSTVNPRQTCPP